MNKAKGSGGDDEGGSADSLAREAAAARGRIEALRGRWQEGGAARAEAPVAVLVTWLTMSEVCVKKLKINSYKSDHYIL